MASERIQITLAELGPIITGKTPSTKFPEYFGGMIPFVTPSDMDGRKVIDSTERTLTDKGASSVKNAIVPARTVMVSCIGSDMGKVAISGQSCVTNQQINSIVVSDDHCADYVYYNLNLRKEEFKSIAAGSAQPILNKGHFAKVPIEMPNRVKQHRIADILGKLDDKIELNRRMNWTLEKMAAAIFKSWFIDFDPVHAKAAPGNGRDPTSGALPAEIADLFPDTFEDSGLGPVPKGWDVKPLDQIADYMNGLACQKHPPVEGQKSLPVIKIRELRQGITNNTDRASVDVQPKYIVEDGDVLFSWSGSLLVSIWSGGRGVLNQHVFKVTSASFPKWYFYQATKHHLDEFQRIASDKATTMGHIKRHHLTDAKMAIPGEALMAKATEVLGTMLDRRINALKQARILALTRDTLLPKLLSGEIDLPEAEAIAEEVSS